MADVSAAHPSSPLDRSTGGTGKYETVGSMLGGIDLSSAAPALSPLGQVTGPTSAPGEVLEYIFTDMHPYHAPSSGLLPERGFGDAMCYGTGTAYLSGLAFGGGWGFVQGVRSPIETPSAKLRLNAVLNAMTRRGPFVANSIGMLAMMYSSTNYLMGKQFGPENAPVSSIASAALAGAVFKSTKGIRSAGISAAVCASLAVLWQATREQREALPIVGAIATRTFT